MTALFTVLLVAGAARMVEVPAGRFVRGCEGAGCEEDATPRRELTLPAFSVDRTEVTQREWAACVRAKKCAPPSCAWDPKTKAEHPVTCVTWGQARDFCKWAGKRLPTEAEWEKAARGSDGRAFPWGNEEPTCLRANFSACGEEPKPVASLPAGASPYGALDMAGNAWEWTADWFDSGWYSKAKGTAGPSKGEVRVVRGGGFVAEGDMLRATYRMGVAPDSAEAMLGFRCVK